MSHRIDPTAAQAGQLRIRRPVPAAAVSFRCWDLQAILVSILEAEGDRAETCSGQTGRWKSDQDVLFSHLRSRVESIFNCSAISCTETPLECIRTAWALFSR